MIQVAGDDDDDESGDDYEERKDKDCGERRHRPYSRCVCNDNDPYSAYSCKSSGSVNVTTTTTVQDRANAGVMTSYQEDIAGNRKDAAFDMLGS